jgi:neutral ceramidase
MTNDLGKCCAARSIAPAASRPRKRREEADMSRRFLVLLLAAACTAATLGAQSGNLRAGAARVDITPPANEFPFPLTAQEPMSSYVGVHDPLYARALVLDDGSTQVAIVIVDVSEIPRHEEFQRTVAQALGIPEANLILAASHTHSEPTMYYHEGAPPGAQNAAPAVSSAAQNAQWTRELDRVIQGAAEAARQAKAQLRPARVSFARGQAWVNIRDGEAGQGDPLGPSDKSLDVLRFDGTEGTPIALLLDYGVPSSIMLHNITRDNGAEVSGDLLGTAAQLIEKQSPNAPVALFASGADGDQRPIFRSTPAAVGKLPAVKEGAAAWDMVDVLGSVLANAALAVTDGMQPGTGEVKISAAAKTVSCPSNKMTRDPATGKTTFEDGPPAQIPLHLIRIGDIAVAGVGGNVGSEIGKKFKASSPLPQSTMVTVTSGSAGYILDDATLANPGSIKTGMLKAGCAENAIVQGLVEMIKAKP